MIIYAGDVSLTQKENKDYSQQSLMCVYSQGFKVNVYSGIERYFKNSFYEESTPLPKKNKVSASAYLVITDSFRILNSYEIDGGAYPFIPLPLKNDENTFSVPIIKNE